MKLVNYPINIDEMVYADNNESMNAVVVVVEDDDDDDVVVVGVVPMGVVEWALGDNDAQQSINSWPFRCLYPGVMTAYYAN